MQHEKTTEVKMSGSGEERMMQQLVRGDQHWARQRVEGTHGHRNQTAAGHVKHEVYHLRMKWENGGGRKIDLDLGKTWPLGIMWGG